MKEIRLLIGICSNRPIPQQFLGAVLELIAYLGDNGIKGHKLTKANYSHQRNVSTISEGRECILQKARDEGYTHVVFIDDDTLFKSNILDGLFSHGVSVIGVNTPRKNDTLQYTAMDLNGEWVKSKGKQGLQQVGAMGMSVFLLELEAIKDLHAPFFEVHWSVANKMYIGEDFYFCRKIRESGVKLYIDHDLSNDIGHIGEYVYRYSSYPGS